MAVRVLKSEKLYVGGYDLSGDFNQINLKLGRDKKEVSAFGDNAHKSVPGLQVAELDGGGFWQGGAAAVDGILYGKLGSNDEVITVCPTDGADGEYAYFMQALQHEFVPGGQVGEVMTFGIAASGSGSAGAVRGTIMTSAAANKTTTTTGTARQLGAASATQKIYAAMHVIFVSGTNPTLDMILQSDDGAGMASPTSRITFTQATGLTAEYKTLAGAVTDDYWRMSWTIGGTATPTFKAIVTVAII